MVKTLREFGKFDIENTRKQVIDLLTEKILEKCLWGEKVVYG